MDEAELTGHKSWASAEDSAGGYEETALVERMAEKLRLGIPARLSNLKSLVPLGHLTVRQQHLSAAWALTVGRLPTVKVADVGGGNGHSYDFLSQAFGHNQVLSYIVFKSDTIARAYSRVGQSLPFKFCSSSDSREKLSSEFHLVIFSCVLQYLEDPHRELGSYSSEFAILMRLPLIHGEKDEIYVQNLQSPDYGTASWPIRLFSRQKFEAEILQRWTILACMEDPGETFPHNGERLSMSTYVLKRKQLVIR
jgi:putative methyltransferase (TIGR04325 family)